MNWQVLDAYTIWELLPEQGERIGYANAFVTLLGGYCNIGGSTWCRLATANDNNSVHIIGSNGDLNYSYPYGRSDAICPALPFDELACICEGAADAQIGESFESTLEYPQNLVSNELERELEQAYTTLTISGRTYTVDSVESQWDEKNYTRGFVPRTLEAVEYNGKRYVRMKALLYIDNTTLKLDGQDKRFKQGQYYFVEVARVRFRRLCDKAGREWALPCHKDGRLMPLFAGVQTALQSEFAKHNYISGDTIDISSHNLGSYIKDYFVGDIEQSLTKKDRDKLRRSRIVSSPSIDRVANDVETSLRVVPKTDIELKSDVEPSLKDISKIEIEQGLKPTIKIEIEQNIDVESSLKPTPNRVDEASIRAAFNRDIEPKREFEPRLRTTPRREVAQCTSVQPTVMETAIDTASLSTSLNWQILNKMTIWQLLSEQYERIAYANAFVTLLGGWLGEDGETWFWVATAGDGSNVRIVDNEGGSEVFCPDSRDGSGLPVLPFEDISSICKGAVMTKVGGVLESSLQYPQNPVARELELELEQAYTTLTRTGRTYTVDSIPPQYKQKNYTRDFMPRILEEVEYQGRRYVRLQAFAYDEHSSIIRNGECELVLQGEYYFVEVARVHFRRLCDKSGKEWALPCSCDGRIMPLFAGVQMDFKEDFEYYAYDAGDKIDISRHNLGRYIRDYFARDIVQGFDQNI